MNNTKLTTFLNNLNTNPTSISFAETMEIIEEQYVFNETAFKNGDTFNEAGKNSGSCKIFAFAEINQLKPETTLECFGDYYRIDVLQNPEGNDHANIRNFIKYGWEGIKFEGIALTPKN